MNLFEISQQRIDQLEQFEHTQDLDLITELDITEKNLNEKIISYDFVIKDLDNKADLVDKQIKRLQEFKKSLKSKENTLKRALLQVVLLFGEDRKLTAAQKQKGLSRGGKKLEVFQDGNRVLLSETIRTKPVYDFDKISEEDNEYTIKINGKNLKKLDKELYEVIKVDQKPSSDKVLRYSETSHLTIR